jgi:hypothetical protein
MKRLSPIFFALLAVACAAPQSAEDETDQTTEDALTACGSAKYAEALAHYKNAVQWSKDRERLGVCQSENGFQWSIADEASRAVMTCGDFRNVIKTSPWAAPVRRVLGNSLTLRSLSGELAVIKDSRWQNWSGVEKFFTTPQGLSFWARAEGAFGSKVRIDFHANGKATYGHLDENDYTWKSESVTYTISGRTVKLTRAGKTETFSLAVESGWAYDDAPIFTLTSSSSSTKLYSLVSECDA